MPEAAPRERRRWPGALALVAALLLGMAGMWLLLRTGPADDRAPQPALLSLEQIGQLATVKVNYANVIEYTQRITQDIPWTQWELRLGATHVLLVARGDCLVGTDMRQARYQAVDGPGRSAVLALPTPQPLSARVNHAAREQGGSYFYAITGSGIEPLLAGSDSRARAIDSALGQAQQDIERHCRSPGVLATARQNAQAVLGSAFAAIGWKVDIRWV